MLDRAERYISAFKEVSTEELTDYAREQSFYCVCTAMKFISENEDLIF